MGTLVKHSLLPLSVNRLFIVRKQFALLYHECVYIRRMTYIKEKYVLTAYYFINVNSMGAAFSYIFYINSTLG